MTDDQLRRQLQQAKAPEASASARARALHRSRIALEQRGTGRSRTIAGQGWSRGWRGTVVVAFIAGLLPLMFLKHTSAPEDVAGDRHLLKQVEELFPNQVDAVVMEKGKVDLSIAQSPVVGAEQPVLLVFRQGRDTIRVLSYSGHRVCLKLGKNENCFEILATPTGGVILESGQKVWVASEHPKVDGYSIHAQTLEAAL